MSGERKLIDRDMIIQRWGNRWVVDTYERGTTEPMLFLAGRLTCDRYFDTKEEAIEFARRVTARRQRISVRLRVWENEQFLDIPVSA